MSELDLEIRRIRETMGKLQLALGAIDESLVWADKNGTVQWSNSPFDRLVGEHRLMLLGADLCDLIPLQTEIGESFITKEEHPVYRVLRDQIPLVEEYVFQRQGGPVYLEIRGRPLQGEESAIFTIHDISERRRTQEALAAHAEHLKRTNESLRQFAYVASHDLQEPLRAIAGYAQILEKRYQDKLDPLANRFLKGMVDGVDRMKNLISGLLRYARTGSEGMKYEYFPAKEAADEAVKNLESRVQESNAIVTIEELPKVVADRSQLTQLFQNLIGNGIKFSKEQPEIHIGAKPVDTNRSNPLTNRSRPGYQFSVVDNGIGIEKEYLENIFTIFRRLHSREEYPGTGIGLAICKRIVERLGGEIWVESTPGKGTSFHFNIPDEEE